MSPPRRERWEKVKPLGRGGQGEVVLERCVGGLRNLTERAVKKIPIERGDPRQIYKRELATIIKFSHDKVSGVPSTASSIDTSFDSPRGLTTAISILTSQPASRGRTREYIYHDASSDLQSLEQVSSGGPTTQESTREHRQSMYSQSLKNERSTTLPTVTFEELSSALRSRNLEAFRPRLQRNPDIVMHSEWTPLLLSAAYGNVELARFLIANGANIFATRDQGNTPLHVCASVGHQAVGRLLIENGANIEARTRAGYTPLQVAAHKGHEAVVRLLLENGAKIEEKDEYGRSSLVLATGKGHQGVVRLLLERGADIEVQTGGDTPLIQAVKEGHEAVVRLLLENGAKIEEKDEHGRSSLVLATGKGHQGVVRLLLERGADIEVQTGGDTPLIQAVKEGPWEFDVFCKRDKHNILQLVTSGLAAKREKFANAYNLTIDVSLLVSPKPKKPWAPLPFIERFDSAHPHSGIPHDPSISCRYSYHDGQESAASPPSSMFDLSTYTGGTLPSTVPVSHAQKSQSSPGSPGASQGMGLLAKDEKNRFTLGDLDETRDQFGQQNYYTEDHEESDTVTIYSIETLSDDPKSQYFQAFVDQLSEDVGAGVEGTVLKNIEPSYVGLALKEFSWRLHEESSNPFQLEISVIIHRRRKNIIDLLGFETTEREISESESDQSLLKSEMDMDNGDMSTRVPFRKTEEAIDAWISELAPDAETPADLSQMPEYKKFIQGSGAYKWLLVKIKQYSRLACEGPSIMDEIGATIRDKLTTQEMLRKMSRTRAPVSVEMNYSVDWDLAGSMRSRGASSPLSMALPNMLSLTGTWDKAQAMTVREYMDQNWPQSGGALVAVLQSVLSALEEEDMNGETSAGTRCYFSLEHLKVWLEDQSINFSVTGGQYLVSEVGEQIAWLVSALQAPSGDHEGFMAISPRVSSLKVHSPSYKGKHIGNTRASCTFEFDHHYVTAGDAIAGLCWKRLFCSPILVCGYPILRRSVPNSGLEISLGLAASIMGSSQVVQLEDRLLIKGFDMLMVATLVAVDVMIWHLFVSEKVDQRISYMDSRIDGTNIETWNGSLHLIEGKRHIVGWCDKATDLCGSSSTYLNIRPAGLPKSPASSRIDKLYIEGGATVVGGFMMDINKKEQPFWLQREKDYPDLLNWVKLQPIVFYDIEERRAWLVDGASALLHLVRISLHQDAADPESAYDWVYDPAKLKDKWPGLGGRQAAVHTLKNWDNRALGLYIVGQHVDASGRTVPKYSTFEDRVKRILHSIEILIDQREKATSQDGFKVSQTWDPRRDIIGFELMDITGPSGPIYPRVQRINSWGHGWTDLVPSIGLTAIFGRGFGDLIRADNPQDLCPKWRLMPIGKDFMAASVSTLQMLFEKRLLKLEPGRSEDEIAKRVTIVAVKESSNPCSCVKKQENNSNPSPETDCHHKPVQFLTRRWWLLGALPNGLVPVRFGSLPVRGAVILGHTVLGLGSKDMLTLRKADDDGTGSTTASDSLQAAGSSSNATESTMITAPSVGSSSQGASGGGRKSNNASNTEDRTRKNKWSKFKDWVKK
ncbi:hypothetical protein ACHAPU_002929 [Fusarium lateritium]